MYIPGTPILVVLSRLSVPSLVKDSGTTMELTWLPALIPMVVEELHCIS